MSYVERLAQVAWYTVLGVSTATAFTLCGRLIRGEPLLPRDATDSATERSGLIPYTDFGTGCQYLGRWGTLVVRLDETGRPMCPKAPSLPAQEDRR